MPSGVLSMRGASVIMVPGLMEPVSSTEQKGQLKYFIVIVLSIMKERNAVSPATALRN